MKGIFVPMKKPLLEVMTEGGLGSKCPDRVLVLVQAPDDHDEAVTISTSLLEFLNVNCRILPRPVLQMPMLKGHGVQGDNPTPMDLRYLAGLYTDAAEKLEAKWHDDVERRNEEEFRQTFGRVADLEKDPTGSATEDTDNKEE